MMKRIFGKKEKVQEEITVESLISRKEEILSQLAEEEKRYETARRNIHQSIAVVETQEVELRDIQLRERRQEYERVTRENQEEQDKIEEKIQKLQMKFDIQKSLHIQQEEKMQGEIESLSHQLEEVRETLVNRIEEFGDPGLPGYQEVSGAAARSSRRDRMTSCASPRDTTDYSSSPHYRKKSLGSLSTLVAKTPTSPSQDGDEEDSYESALDRTWENGVSLHNPV